MQYEGEHRQIPMRGIERATAEGVAQDGGMAEIINLIPRNGSFVPYSPAETPEKTDTDINRNTLMVRVHHTSTGDNTIIVYENYYLIKGVVDGTPFVIRKDTVVRDIVFIGNRMDLSTSEGIEHWLWKNGEYINNDNLGINTNHELVLPYVNFKVSRGIYDGSTVYKSARFVKLHKNYTDSDTTKEDEDAASSYVRELGSLGADAMCLLDSIRYAGGITGYVLVAAAWRVKGSKVTNPRYIMASPILLMGAPEIYTKDKQYEDKTDGSLFDCPTKPYFVDTMMMESGKWGDTLWDLRDSDDRELDDLSENEHVFIEMSEEKSECAVNFLEQNTSRSTQFPPLVSNKYALWSNPEKEHRGYRITSGTANVLYYRVSEELPEKYKDEIDRLCLFVSPVVSPYKKVDVSGIRMESNYKDNKEDDSYTIHRREFRTSASAIGLVKYGISAGSFSPLMKSEEEIREQIKNIAGLYKVAEVQLNELKTDEWVKVNLSDGKLNTDKMVQSSDTMLKITDLQPVGFITGKIFGYNERLHVFNFQRDDVFRLPYKSLAYYDGEGQYHVPGNERPVNCVVDVEDSNGSIIVDKFVSETGVLNPLVSCADIDAKEIRVSMYRNYQQTIRDYDGAHVVTRYTAGDVSDKPIAMANIFGGFINADLRPIKIPLLQVTEAEYNSIVREEKILPDSKSYGKNEIRVSNTSSIIFELDKTYRVGHGEIIALARLSIGLSQDNYSKYPLIVFCTDGVYTLSVDASGKFAYGSQDPLSRAVCTNPNGICEIDGAVLFPTEYGLQMATADGIKPVALQAIGKPKNIPTDSNGLSVYKNAIRHQSLVYLYDDLSWEDFLKDIQYEDTRIRYVHALNSVIVYNRVKPYSYIINLESWMVTKTEQAIYIDDGDYPKKTFWAFYNLDGEFHPIRFDYYNGQDNTQCMFATCPIALESRHLKTAYRVVLRGTFDNTQSNKQMYAGMYVFGSLDAEHWDYLNGTEKLLTGNRFHDIGVETHHVSYKYMMIVFVGALSEDSHIDGLEITSNEKYNNKLK